MIAIVFVFSTKNAYALEARWDKIYETEYGVTYVDVQTIMQDGRNVFFWVRDNNKKNSDYYLKKYYIVTDTKMLYQVNEIKYMNDGPHNIPVNPGAANPRYKICPDSNEENIVNHVLRKVGLPKLYPQNTWKWFHSTDKTSYYIASRACYINDVRKFVAWVKTTSLSGYTTVRPYIIDIEKSKIRTTYGDYQMIIPDTIQERVFNAAKELYDMGSYDKSPN